jgi:hypothetical protein
MPIVLRTEAVEPGGSDVNEHIQGGPLCSDWEHIVFNFHTAELVHEQI